MYEWDEKAACESMNGGVRFDLLQIVMKNRKSEGYLQMLR